MTNIYKLKGTIQHYVWGGNQYIPHLLNIQANHSHYAELWLGAHSAAPAIIEKEQKPIPLNQFLQQNPTALGQQSRQKFGNRLPYLLKVLDVKEPLSIQLHPTKQQAELGFARENQQNIPLTHSKRTYKDDNHKPEMMIALSDFWLLHGFKPKQQIIDSLKIRPSLTPLAEQLTQQDLASFYTMIMQADNTQLAPWLTPILEQNQGKTLPLTDPDYWVCYTVDSMQLDPQKLDAGLMCFYLFNLVHLKTGEGIYQAAGIPHAYLRGQNIELMAESDNVIRGGLTPKHIDIQELLKVIDYQEITPKIIQPATQQYYTYPTPAKDFALTQLCYQQGQQYQHQAENAEILLVMQGKIQLSNAQETLELEQGQSAFICAESNYQIEGVQTGYAVIAKSF
ncbi:mannose-6-phosphate isomerase type 1 [Volucribacter psittacicida]|uniref:mannose-6-phosphate isomerase n=1 Tax=Volucribacter psittacicida TaxID=203482 RepID=A0A4R1G1J4_9PAST|nr:mannose-6-phosphate isomerase, class I [Volucribacter psittacicida]TCK01408.1 mannose-6-phosphate isomerase type 1 [Volucribacter psittacicida]